MTQQVVDGDGGMGGGAHIVVDVKGAGVVVALALTASRLPLVSRKLAMIVPRHLTIRDGDVRGESGTGWRLGHVGEQGVVDRRGRTGSTEEDYLGADAWMKRMVMSLRGPGVLP